MTEVISASEAKRRIHGTEELALLDVREHGQYGEGHLLFASNCPYSRLELEAPRLVPNPSVPCIIYDDGDGVAERAAGRLAALDYTRVYVLQDGVRGWAAAGYGLFKGVNVPSKVFGELVEAVHHTPVISADQLDQWRAAGRDLLLVDGRPMADFAKMNIPGARCVPNGELLYRFGALVKDDETPIVINCAGRTRGLIGAQSLISAGLPNPVFALENGTQGWVLSGRELDRRSESLPLPHLSAEEVAQGRDLAERLAATYRVPSVGAEEVWAWSEDTERTLYLLDVRTEEEFLAGHVAGARHAPAVQLVQATDEWVAVRHARLALIDDNGLRATTAAFWLRQMGHDAVVVREALTEMATQTGPDESPLDSRVPLCCGEISARELLDANDDAPLLLDIRSSRAHRKRRIPGSVWSTRARLGRLDLSAASSLVLVADDPRTARLAACDASALTDAPILLLKGGVDAWEAAGEETEPSPAEPDDAEAIDFLQFVHDRHDGNLEASRRYLDWETGLVGQLDDQERAEFDVVVVEPADG
ncbi:MAG: hypothetical protein Tsb0032_13650 [Kiloniellaceae bacterium]